MWKVEGKNPNIEDLKEKLQNKYSITNDLVRILVGVVIISMFVAVGMGVKMNIHSYKNEKTTLQTYLDTAIHQR